jgi:spermidine/putrescine transport system permease protein
MTGSAVTWRTWILMLPLGLFIVLFFVTPFLSFFVYSFWQVSGWDLVQIFTLKNYARVFTDPIYPGLALRSLEVGIGAGLMCVLIAYPLSYLMAFKARRYRDLLLFLILLTLFSNYLIRIYAWRSVLSTNGLLDVILVGLGLVREPQSYLLFSPFGTLLALTNVYVPVALLPIYSALLNIPRNLIDASRDLGASPLRAFAKVTLPLSTPGVVAAFAFVFLLSAGDFVTPQLVGGTNGSMIGMSIQSQFGEAFNWPLGSAIAMTMMVIMALTLGLLAIAGRRLGVLRRET